MKWRNGKVGFGRRREKKGEKGRRVYCEMMGMGGGGLEG
jgi:hypothetical protein